MSTTYSQRALFYRHFLEGDGQCGCGQRGWPSIMNFSVSPKLCQKLEIKTNLSCNQHNCRSAREKTENAKRWQESRVLTGWREYRLGHPE